MATGDRLTEAVLRYVIPNENENIRQSLNSARSVRRFQDPHETLEKILNKTTLTTQRLNHVNIIKVGGDMLSRTTDNNLEGFERSIQEAVDAAEARSTRELQAALHRQRQRKDEERKLALQKQKEYSERLAQRISDQRDRAEEERMKDLIHKMELEKEEALRQQWEMAERGKEKAVTEACLALKKQLEAKHAIDKKDAVTTALQKAQVEYNIREKEAIQATRKICQEEEKIRAAKQEDKHKEYVEKLDKRYEILQMKCQREVMQRTKVEKDFCEIQDDYKRFLDYTDGHFHSDYLMMLRNLGRLPKVLEDNVISEDITKINI